MIAKCHALPTRLAALLVAAGLGIGGAAAQNQGGDTVNCAVDQPCFTGFTQKCHDVIFDFGGGKSWDVYHIRWSGNGPEKVGDNTSGHYTITNAQAATTYRFKVQGCVKHMLKKDECSPWVEASVTTAGDYGPDTCFQGYVWRGVSAEDHVCVRPKDRDDTAAQTAQAAANRQPANGNPDACKPGLTWRLATPNDRVCVQPPVHDIQRTWNAAAGRRKICG